MQQVSSCFLDEDLQFDTKFEQIEYCVSNI